MSLQENALISIVIPTYNRADLITDALDSVCAQTYRPIELLIVDDGSTDETEAVVNEWVEGRGTRDLGRGLRVEGRGSKVEGQLAALDTRHSTLVSQLSIRYIHQDNLGGNPARNHGIREAKGNYIAFLDSDDAWLPEKLEKQMKKFEDPQVVAVYCGVRHMDFESGRILEPSDRLYPEGNLLEQLLVRDVTVQTSAYVVRKSVFDQVGPFDTELQARQDWDMWIRVATAGKIACVPEPLVNFREHAGVRTASNPMKEINGYRAIRKKYAHLLSKASLSCRLQARSAYLKRMGRVHHKHPELNSTKAPLYALSALLTWPFDFDAWAALAGMFLPKGFRQSLHRSWNTVFGRTRLAIRSH